MNKVRLWKAPVWAALLLLLTVGAYQVFAAGSGPDAAEVPTEEKPLPGYLAPNFELTTLDGETVRLSDYRGKPVLINFWATWCPPCREEMPDIQAFHEKMGDEVVILGVNLREPPQTVRAFVEEFGYTWTFPLDRDGAVTELYGVRYIPTSFWLDRNGVIRQVYPGPMTEELMRTLLLRTRSGS